LREDGSARGALGEFSFGGGEGGFEQLALVALFGEVVSHLGMNTMDLPALVAAFGRDDAIGAELLADEGVIALAVNSPSKSTRSMGLRAHACSSAMNTSSQPIAPSSTSPASGLLFADVYETCSNQICENSLRYRIRPL